MRIRWTPPAAADLQNISDYLKKHHPQHRQPTVRKLYQSRHEASFIRTDENSQSEGPLARARGSAGGIGAMARRALGPSRDLGSPRSGEGADARPHRKSEFSREKIRALRDAPYVGRPGRVEGTRELLFLPLPYIAVYRVTEQTIEVWRVYHTSQDRP